MELCLPLLLLLCICRLGMTEEPSPTPEIPNPTGTTSQGVVVVEEEVEVEEEESCGGAQVFSPESHQAVGGAIEQLGLLMLEKLQIGSQQSNIIISPLSLALALAQLALGAGNETEKLLMSALHADRIPCYHKILGSLQRHLRNTSMDVATRMYLRPGFDVKLAFVEESLARYQSRPAPLVSLEEVNQWVENATHGHITNFLPSIPHDVVLMLINAVYFKGEWQTRFDPKATSKGMFYLDHQKSVSVDMMKSAQYPLRLLHHPELEAQVASFPFKGNTSFLVVMPLPGRGNISSVLPKLNISDLYRRLPQERTMQVNLPKFKLQYRQDLEEVLSSMGLGTLFTGPDLSGISDHPLKVTGIRHASGMELSEEGAEAAAATVVTTMRTVSLFSVNSPFFFALMDDTSLTPLFLGVVTNPALDDAPVPNEEPLGNSTQSDEPSKDNEGEINTEQSSDAVSNSDPQSSDAISNSAPKSNNVLSDSGTQSDEPRGGNSTQQCSTSTCVKEPQQSQN